MRSTITSAHPSTRKGCSTVMYGLLLLFGLAFLAAVGMAFINTAKPYFWTKTVCTILEAKRDEPEVPQRKNSDGVLIRYRYEVDGSQYTSTQFTKGAKESLSSQKIERLLRQYPKGTRKACYVDPRNPRESILKRGPLWIGFFTVIPMIILGVGVAGLMATYSPPPAALTADAARRGRIKKLGKSAPLLFFGLFALVGGILSYFLVARTVLKYFDARSWPEIPCQIVSSSVGSHRSTSKGSSTTYSVDITYRYRFDGSDYESDQYEIFGGSSSGYKGKAAIVAQYPSRSRSVCYVNPRDPTEALLSRSPSPIWLVGLIPLLFFCVGVSGLVAYLRKALRASGTIATPVLPAGAALPPGLPSLPTNGGAVDLKPSASPVAKFFGMVLVALFWNGITGIFATMAVRSWLRHDPEIFLSLFITPFVLIGLGLIGGVVYSFLGLFNPRLPEPDKRP